MDLFVYISILLTILFLFFSALMKTTPSYVMISFALETVAWYLQEKNFTMTK